MLIGCGDQTTSSPTTTAPDSLTLGARFADGFQAPTVIAAGSPQRAPYVLIGADGWPATDVPDRIEMTVTQGDTVVHTGTVDRHGEDHVIPYFPLVFTPPTAGDYAVRSAGMPGRHRLRVAEAGELDLVQVGDQMVPVDTPTIADPLDVTPICTWPDGPCPLHGLTIREALARRGPTALLIATPRFCQQDVCGPAVDVVVAEAADRGGSWSVVHAEVFVAPDDNDFTLAPAVTAYGLTFEPSLVVADRDGVVTAVLHFTMDAVEVREAFDTAV